MRFSITRLNKRIWLADTNLLEKEKFIKAPWGQIAVLMWGDARNKPVILVHGKMDSAAVFRPLVQRLPRQFYYIGVELPGNGRSDHMPCGVTLSVPDLVPALRIAVEHFKCHNFAYVAHSLGVNVGKFYQAAYPDGMAVSVELDPMPAYMESREASALGGWYRYFYESYYGDKYDKFNADKGDAPKHDWNKLIQTVMRNRGISREMAELSLERITQPTSDGLYRLTYDQRMKFVTRPLFSPKMMQEFYTGFTIPLLVILAQQSIDDGHYDLAKFVMDPESWKNDYRCEILDAGHDLHLSEVDSVARTVGNFLIEKYS